MWPKERLSAITTRIGGGTPARDNKVYWGGEVPWFTVADLQDVDEIQSLTTSREGITPLGLKCSAAKLVPAGAVVFSSRVVVGKVGIAKNDLATNQDFSSFVPSPKVDNEFLAYFLINAKNDLRVSQRGATIKGITTAVIDELEIPLPPKAEQRRIVSRIKACMERVEEIERDATEASREIDAVLPAVLNERFAEILAAYRSQALEEVADIRGGGSLPKGAPNDLDDASVLLVKVGDMNIEGNDRVIGVAREFLARLEAGRNTIPCGAVVLPKRGGAIATNKKRMLGRPALIDPNLMAIVARPDVFSAEYLYYWSLTLDLAALSNGGVIPQLNRKDLAPLQVPIPPLDVQQQIVESLKRAETYCGQLRTEFDAAQVERAQLRESILRKAFAGEL